MNHRKEPQRPDYVYADLSRAGLGNCMFPWARAVVAAKEYDRPMLPPKWLRFRVGPYLRGDMDKRNYWKLFRAPTAVQMADRARLLATATLVDEAGRVVRARRGPTVQVFRVINEFFQPLYGHREVIAQELRRIARPGVISPDYDGEYIAMHVRRGDFIRSRGDEPPGEVNLTTSITWFTDAVSWLRGNGWDGEILVFSDGTEEELAELTAQQGVRRHEPRNAPDDMFRMARSRLIIGSASSFCAWSAFLGDVPIALEYGRNPFLTGPLVHEVARWTDDVAPGLLTALSDRR